MARKSLTHDCMNSLVENLTTLGLFGEQLTDKAFRTLRESNLLHRLECTGAADGKMSDER